MVQSPLKQPFQVKVTRTYFSQQFHDDLKLLFQAAGIGENKQQVVFLFDDTQVVEETFLEDRKRGKKIKVLFSAVLVDDSRNLILYKTETK